MNLTDSFRAARWIRLVNLILQALLFLTLFAGLNYLALNHAWRFDLTRHRLHSLSAETRSYLDRLDRDVRVVVTLTEDSDSEEVAQAYRDISNLLREYTYATTGKREGKGLISVEYLDVYQRRRDADALNIAQPNVLVLLCAERRRVVPLSELYRTRVEGPARALRREAFLGEAALTAAILDVSYPDKKKIYFLAGHGEISPDDVTPRGLSQIRDELRLRNFALEALDLALTKKIPDDAALLLDVSLRSPFHPFEEELLRNYLTTRAGRFLLLLSPGLERTGLEDLFLDWGVRVHDNVIYDHSANYLSESHELILRRVLPSHPITQYLADNQLPLVVGPARPVTPVPGRTLDDGLNVKTLVATFPSAWGEKNYRLTIPPQYEEGDLRESRNGLGVVVASERVKPANLALSVPGGRLAVFGTADLVTNNHIANQGNLHLFLAATNWAVDRDNQLNIPARPIQRFQLALSQEELTQLRLGLFLLVPGAAAMLGLLVYWARQN